jgi:hypothetical protein
VFITIIGSDGNHVDPDSWPITNDPAIVLSSHPSAAKTVTKVDDGVFKVVWSSLSPALTHGEIIYISIDGAISGTAWTTWVTPIQVVHLPAKVSDTQDIQNRLPAALVGGRMDSYLGATANNVITHNTLATNCIGNSQLATSAINAIQSGLATSAQATAIEADTQDIQNRLPSTLVGGKMNSNVASMNADTLTASALAADAVSEIQSSVMGLNSPSIIERSTDDQKDITFSWPVSGATITVEKSVDNGSYEAATGTVSYLRQEGNKYYYVLDYNAADRLNEEGVVRYKLNDGTYTKYFSLRLVAPGITAEEVALEVLDTGDIDGYTIEEALKLVLSVLAGKVSGGGTTEITFRAADDSKDRVVATITSAGNRTSITLDADG